MECTPKHPPWNVVTPHPSTSSTCIVHATNCLYTKFTRCPDCCQSLMDGGRKTIFRLEPLPTQPIVKRLYHKGGIFTDDSSWSYWHPISYECIFWHVKWPLLQDYAPKNLRGQLFSAELVLTSLWWTGNVSIYDAIMWGTYTQATGNDRCAKSSVLYSLYKTWLHECFARYLAFCSWRPPQWDPHPKM